MWLSRDDPGEDLPVPAGFSCPLCHGLVRDPVSTADGHSFCSSCIESAFRGHDALHGSQLALGSGKAPPPVLSPATKLPLPSRALLRNTPLASAVASFQETRRAWEQQRSYTAQLRMRNLELESELTRCGQHDFDPAANPALAKVLRVTEIDRLKAKVAEKDAALHKMQAEVLKLRSELDRIRARRPGQLETVVGSSQPFEALQRELSQPQAEKAQLRLAPRGRAGGRSSSLGPADNPQGGSVRGMGPPVSIAAPAKNSARGTTQFPPDGAVERLRAAELEAEVRRLNLMGACKDTEIQRLQMAIELNDQGLRKAEAEMARLAAASLQQPAPAPAMAPLQAGLASPLASRAWEGEPATKIFGENLAKANKDLSDAYTTIEELRSKLAQAILASPAVGDGSPTQAGSELRDAYETIRDLMAENEALKKGGPDALPSPPGKAQCPVRGQSPENAPLSAVGRSSPGNSSRPALGQSPPGNAPLSPRGLALSAGQQSEERKQADAVFHQLQAENKALKLESAGVEGLYSAQKLEETQKAYKELQAEVEQLRNAAPAVTGGGSGGSPDVEWLDAYETIRELKAEVEELRKTRPAQLSSRDFAEHGMELDRIRALTAEVEALREQSRGQALHNEQIVRTMQGELDTWRSAARAQGGAGGSLVPGEEIVDAYETIRELKAEVEELREARQQRPEAHQQQPEAHQERPEAHQQRPPARTVRWELDEDAPTTAKEASPALGRRPHIASTASLGHPAVWEEAAILQLEEEVGTLERRVRLATDFFDPALKDPNAPINVEENIDELTGELEFVGQRIRSLTELREQEMRDGVVSDGAYDRELEHLDQQVARLKEKLRKTDKQRRDDKNVLLTHVQSMAGQGQQLQTVLDDLEQGLTRAQKQVTDKDVQLATYKATNEATEEELADLEELNNNLRSEVENLRNRLAKTRATSVASEEEIVSLEDSLANTEADLAKVREELDDLVLEHAEIEDGWRRDNTKLKDEKKNLQAEIDRLKASADKHTQVVDTAAQDLQTENDTLMLECKQHQDALNLKKDELKALKDELNALKAVNDRSTAAAADQANKQQQEIDKLKKQVDDLTKALADKNRKEASASADQTAALQQQAQSLQRQLSDTAVALQAKSTELESVRGRLASAREQANKQQQEIDKLKKQVDDLTKALADKNRKEASASADQTAALQQQAQSLQRQLADAAAALQAKSTELESVRGQLAAAQEQAAAQSTAASTKLRTTIQAMVLPGALLRAAQDSNVPQAKALLDARADVNELDTAGQAPLHVASYLGNETLVKELLQAGARVGVRDATGETPLHEAARAGRDGTAALLLAAGAKPDVQDSNGVVPLHKAAYAGSVAVVQSLCQAKANLNSRDKQGWTPLFYTAMSGNARVATALLEAGAKKDVAAKNGKLPIVAARERGNTSVETVIQQAP